MIALPSWFSVLLPAHALPAFFFFSLIYGFTLPISEEIALLLIGVLAARYRLSFIAVAGVVFPGCLGADFLYYGLARFFGPRLMGSKLLKRFIKAENVLASEVYFARKGNQIAFFFRFIVGIRVPALIASGLFRMPFPVFAFYNSVSAFISCTAWLGIGFFWGARIGSQMGVIAHILTILTPLSVALVLYFMFRRIRDEQKAILREVREKNPEGVDSLGALSSFKAEDTLG